MTDEGNNVRYKIKREDCSCGNSWLIYDLIGNQRGRIEQEGCCFLSYNVELPD